MVPKTVRVEGGVSRVEKMMAHRYPMGFLRLSVIAALASVTACAASTQSANTATATPQSSSPPSTLNPQPFQTDPSSSYWVYVGAESADLIHRVRFAPGGAV